VDRSRERLEWRGPELASRSGDIGSEGAASGAADKVPVEQSLLELGQLPIELQ